MKKQRSEGQIEKDLLKIQSQAKRESQQIRGVADGKALRILARAYNKNPEFFCLLPNTPNIRDFNKR